MKEPLEIPSFCAMTDLAAERLGGKVLYATDDFFAAKENLIKPGRGIFIEDKYTDRGKWMDGWESRRKRTPGHDWCIIQLATTGMLHGVDIDTNHFLGNHPPFASIEACKIDDGDINELQNNQAIWTEILSKSPLNAGSQNFYNIQSKDKWTHLKLHIYPDGGVARLKVYGEVSKDWNRQSNNELIDLAAAINGGKAISCNDMFFSSKDNINMPGRGINMGDGWETKRNRNPENRDWLILKLAHRGTIEKVLIDTCHFKGNYPDSFTLDGLDVDDETKVTDQSTWQAIIPKTKLEADCIHEVENEIARDKSFTHVRLNIFPDGGVSRMRLFGRISLRKFS